MNIFRKLVRLCWKSENVALENLYVRYFLKTSSDKIMVALDEDIKLDRPYFDNKDNWYLFKYLHNKIKSNRSDEFNKRAQKLLEIRQEPGYEEIIDGCIVRGKHIVKCDWEIQNGKIRKKLTNKDWEDYLKYGDKNGMR